MKPLWLDFETYWSEDYTLRKMTPVEYIYDPRFEALGCAFVDADPSLGREWVDGPLLPEKFAEIDWADTYVISHNALFDALILSFKYGIVPKMYGCTLSMARNWISHSTGKVSLAECAKFYGLGAKWDTVNKTKGISFSMLQQMPNLHEEVGDYAIDDATKCRDLFKRIMSEGFPRRELRVIDMVVRMASQPRFVLDQEQLALHLNTVKNDKAELLAKAELDEPLNLMSDAKFAGLLLWEGVTPPQKMSKKTGKLTYAFAKTDKAFTHMAEHPSPRVQALVAARLGFKTTLEETRTERLLSIANCGEAAPIPLKYSGAHTHRFSGDWKINMQNLKRGGRLRKALKAPKGYLVVSVDAAQIEARLNATLSGQRDLMAAFATGIEVYAQFAEEIYQHPVTKETHPTERFVGKTGILSLGYGASAPRFQDMCRTQGKVTLTLGECSDIVGLYRKRYPKIVDNWYYADRSVLPRIAHQSAPLHWGPVITEKWALLLPNGNRLRYRDLHYEGATPAERARWMFMRGNQPTHIYGAKLTENVIQALAFVYITEVALKVLDMEGLYPAHQVHDELIYLVPEADAERVKDLVVALMSTPPTWMPDAPVAAEGHIGPSYGDVK